MISDTDLENCLPNLFAEFSTPKKKKRRKKQPQVPKKKGPPVPPKPKKPPIVITLSSDEEEMIGNVKTFDSSVDDIDMWIGDFRAFPQANKLDETKEVDKCMGIFISSLGLHTYTLLVNLLSPDDPSSKKLTELITVLQDHFKPAPKAIAERFRFTGR